jgi:hypothetical protein
VARREVGCCAPSRTERSSFNQVYIRTLQCLYKMNRSSVLTSLCRTFLLLIYTAHVAPPRPTDGCGLLVSRCVPPRGWAPTRSFLLRRSPRITFGPAPTCRQGRMGRPGLTLHHTSTTNWPNSSCNGARIRHFIIIVVVDDIVAPRRICGRFRPPAVPREGLVQQRPEDAKKQQRVRVLVSCARSSLMNCALISPSPQPPPPLWPLLKKK